MKYAVIDIGSNSVRLMLWADGTLYKKLFTTRLAAGMRNGLLADDAMRRTAEAVAACFEEGVREAGRGNTFAFATAAVRTAVNGDEFCGLVKKLCGLTIDVVAGETEALLGALGAVGSGDGGMVDIGGASTEVFVRENVRLVQYLGLAVMVYGVFLGIWKHVSPVEETIAFMRDAFLLLGGFILLIGSVFKAGIRIKEEQDLTI